MGITKLQPMQKMKTETPSLARSSTDCEKNWYCSFDPFVNTFMTLPSLHLAGTQSFKTGLTLDDLKFDFKKKKYFSVRCMMFKMCQK